ncbi:hypothetical protein DMA12_20750 [Amycolatopsis balhimycina DSM 5908]|uniref:Uncharacterized protein n=2 Tax=Amycolatopsis balhimycina TaxID=208443 RepID=A0A428WHT3_AMYBA|nr:hypothetical protein DMA12_20750 [Amycolatopsis balhimycina DSM 5908]
MARALKAALEVSTATLRNLPGAIDLSVPGAKIRLADLLRRDDADVLQVTVDKLMTNVLDALQTRRGAIMIDDAEDVFPGIVENPRFLEGVVRAVSDINVHSGNRIHALLLIKHGLWRSWYENQREYDRVKHSIGFLSWDHSALVELIARRICHREGITVGSDGIDVRSLWSRRFAWSGDFEVFTRFCTRHCVSGSRDIVALCNMAAARAGDALIGQEHIEACLGKYAEDKLYNLNADYGDTYPDISQFVERVFQGAAAMMTGTELAQMMGSRALLTPAVDRKFNRLTWYANATQERLAKIMYEVGVIGYESPRGPVHAIENPNLSTADLLSKDALFVHPAFRPHLAIVQASPDAEQ